jgi:hypothetical protein
MVVAGRELGARHEVVVVVVVGFGFGASQTVRARETCGSSSPRWPRFRQGTIVTAEPNAVPSAGCTAMCR